MRFLPIALLLASTSAIAQTVDLTAKPASPATLSAQATARAAMPRDDGSDLEFARRGFIATLEDPVIRDANGKALIDLEAFSFVEGQAPGTANPALWRHIGVLRHHGLFKLSEGMWQIRGFDISNMTVIGGKTGWIIIDPLMRKETAAAAIRLVNEQLGARPVVAVIYTHTHIDHFGGVRGLTSLDDVKAGKIVIIAPDHFMDEMGTENVIAGPAMSRRANYQMGGNLAAGPTGMLGDGMGTVMPGGETTLIAPTDIIKSTGDTRLIDGVTLEFQMVPQTEAPAELNVFVPERRTFVIGEIATCSLHNILTPRGAQVRDAAKWADNLTEALRLYADRSDTIGESHCWPRFGKAEVRNFLTLQRDNYKFIHDQSVRRMNQGANATELAEAIDPPAALKQAWFAHGFYGTYNHDAKAVYQRYLGWYDAVPANLNPLIPTERAAHYVAAMGGAAKVMAMARTAMDKGEYRWSSDLLNQLVFAEPNNLAARALLADSYEQQGYQAESSLWRNMFLTGAMELRSGVPKQQLDLGTDVAATLSSEMLLASLATRLNPALIGDRKLAFNLTFTDRNETVALSVGNAVMVTELGRVHARPQLTLSGPRLLFLALFFQKVSLATLEAQGLKVDGDRAAIEPLLAALEAPTPGFNIVTP